MALSDEDKRWVAEQLEGLETRLLTAFHSWASPAEARLRGHSEILHAHELEVADLRDRVKKLESGRTQ